MLSQFRYVTMPTHVSKKFNMDRFNRLGRIVIGDRTDPARIIGLSNTYAFYLISTIEAMIYGRVNDCFDVPWREEFVEVDMPRTTSEKFDWDRYKATGIIHCSHRTRPTTMMRFTLSDRNALMYKLDVLIWYRLNYD